MLIHSKVKILALSPVSRKIHNLRSKRFKLSITYICSAKKRFSMNKKSKCGQLATPWIIFNVACYICVQMPDLQRFLERFLNSNKGELFAAPLLNNVIIEEYYHKVTAHTHDSNFSCFFPRTLLCTDESETIHHSMRNLVTNMPM